MTATVTFVGKPYTSGNKKIRIADLDITSYTSSGEAVTAANFGLKKLDYIRFIDGTSDNGHVWRWDDTNDKVRVYKLGAGSGIVTESFPDVKGGNFANQASSGSAGTNDAFVIAAAAANTTAKTTIANEPNTAASTPGNAAAGRNVKVVVSSAGGGTLPADCGTATVVGTDQFGTALTEAIALSPMNGDVLGAGGVEWVVGTKVFATVTSLTLSINLTSSIADAQVSLGLGTIFGLRGKITAESDVKSVRKDSADVSSATYVGSSTLHSVDLGADCADDVDLIISYDAVASSLVDREAASAVDCGAMRVEAVGV